MKEINGALDYNEWGYQKAYDVDNTYESIKSIYNYSHFYPELNIDTEKRDLVNTISKNIVGKDIPFNSSFLKPEKTKEQLLRELQKSHNIIEGLVSQIVNNQALKPHNL